MSFQLFNARWAVSLSFFTLAACQNAPVPTHSDPASMATPWPTETASPSSRPTEDPDMSPEQNEHNARPEEARRVISGRVVNMNTVENVTVQVELYQLEASRHLEIPVDSDGAYTLTLSGAERELPVRLQALERVNGELLTLSEWIQVPPPTDNAPSEVQALPLAEITSTRNAARLRVAASHKVNLTGQVYDEAGQPLEGVSLWIRSLDESLPFERRVQSNLQGQYREAVPQGAALEITAEKAGYSTRSQRFQAPQGAPSAELHFGTATDPKPEQNPYALTRQPEIHFSSIQPGTTGIAFEPEIVLGFNQPVQPESFEQAFVLEASRSVKLTVDQGSPEIYSIIGADRIQSGLSPLHWTRQDFNFDWNADSTEVTLSFKAGRQLPSDSQISRLPEYQMRLLSPLISAAGVARHLPPFALEPGEFLEALSFQVRADQSTPRLNSVEYQPGELVDRFVLSFSEAMSHRQNSVYLDAGMAQGSATRPLAPAGYSWRFLTDPRSVAVNYRFRVSDFNGQEYFDGTAQLLDGQVMYDERDARRIIIEFPLNARKNWVRDRQLEVSVLPSIADPAGRRMDPNHLKARLIF